MTSRDFTTYKAFGPFIQLKMDKRPCPNALWDTKLQLSQLFGQRYTILFQVQSFLWICPCPPQSLNSLQLEQQEWILKSSASPIYSFAKINVHTLCQYFPYQCRALPSSELVEPQLLLHSSLALVWWALDLDASRLSKGLDRRRYIC